MNNRPQIHWIRTNPGASAEEGSYYTSSEGRFQISPRFRSTVYPDSYNLWDNFDKQSYHFDTITECKVKALGLCQLTLIEEGVI